MPIWRCKMQEYKGVQIPTTGGDWQLYTTSMACGKAARSLTAALKRSIRSFDRMTKDRSVVNALADAYYCESGIYEKMDELSGYGAADSEPRWVAQNALEEYAALRVYGDASMSDRFRF
jgi:6-phosphogluconate dehydrogenase (decarboxylating)